MGLLDEIQNEAVGSKSDLGQLLRKCKVLAARLDSKPLGQWLICESEGYPAEMELPAYRRWAVGVKAHFAGPFQSGMHNVEVPPLLIPEEFRDTFTRYECRDSVAVLQEMIASGSDGLFHCDTGNLVVLLGRNVISGMNCIQAWGEFSASRIVQVLDTVRNRVLDFALALGKENPQAGEVGGGGKHLSAETITQIFNTTVSSGTATVVGTANHSTINVKVKTGDWESLAAHLTESGVAKADLDALAAALKAEPTLGKSGKFGAKVGTWIGNMTAKAASGAWNVAVGTGSALLTAALMKYYGLS